MPRNIEVSIARVNRRVYGRAKYALRVKKTEEAETFGERVKRLREGLKVKTSQTKLAKAAGIKQSSMSVIEDGTTKLENIKATTLRKLAVALDVSQAYLATGVEPPAEPEPVGDPLVEQLMQLYEALDDDGKHDLVHYANYIHTKQHPESSTANPHGNGKKTKTTA